MSLPEAIRQAVGYQLDHLHTALPGRVESFDPTTGRATVQPVVKKRYADGRVESLPVVPNVPVVWPRTGAAALSLKLVKGDGVLLVFAERALERWLALGGEQEPGAPRRHDLSDAVAIPGLYPFTEAPPTAGHDDDARLAAGLARLSLADGAATLAGTEATLRAGTAAFHASGAQVALGAAGIEVLALLAQALQLAATSTTTTPGSPVTPNPGLAALLAQLQAITGSLPP